MKILNLSLTLLISGVLSACGGGGGSADTTAVTPVVTTCTASNVGISYPSTGSSSVGQAVSFAPSGSLNTACAGATYAVTGTLPTGLSFSATTGVLTGSATTVGSYAFSINLMLSSAILTTYNVSYSVTAAVSGTVVVSGFAMNQVLVNNATGALDYASPVNKPMRGVTVEALQGTTVLTSATALDTGAFSLNVPVNSGLVSLRIKAALKSTTGAIWDVQVLDNTNSNAIYALTSATFTVGTANVVQNMTAGSGWSTSGTVTGVRASAPFAILDTAYSAIKKVTSVAATTSFPALAIYWSVNNTPSSGSLTTGQIGTSFFNGTGIYILGKAGTDTDEFDETVIAHEWGHYAQSAFSRDDSLGGSHGSVDKLDMRVAFSEGWGNGWSGIATNRSYYSDSSWSGTTATGFTLDLSSSTTSSGNQGWYSEMSVAYMIYDLNRQVGFAPIFTALKQMRSLTALSTIYSFQASLPVGASATAMSGLMSSQGITGTGLYGAGESNLPGYPPYRVITVGSAGTNTCMSDPYGVPNKLGNYSALRFTASVTGNRTITVSSAGTKDPDFDVYQNGVLIASANSSVVGSETKAVTVAAGDVVIVATIYELTGPTQTFTGTQCVNVTVQ